MRGRIEPELLAQSPGALLLVAAVKAPLLDTPHEVVSDYLELCQPEQSRRPGLPPRANRQVRLEPRNLLP